MRILVVDDQFQSRWAIAHWLSVFLGSVAIEPAASAAEALAAIETRKPDLVLAACEAAGADFWLEKRDLKARLLAFLQQRFSLRVVRQSLSF